MSMDIKINRNNYIQITTLSTTFSNKLVWINKMLVESVEPSADGGCKINMFSGASWSSSESANDVLKKLD